MFAVLDVETTGLWQRTDRIVEIAVVRLDQACRTVDEWVTLVNPNRDLGPTSIHGITGRHVVDAPTFAEIAGDVVDHLADAIVVGHNVRFDIGFVCEEFARLGYELPAVDGLCTMELTSWLFDSPRRLGDCCQHLGIAHEGSHSALGDARAAARLLGACLEGSRRAGQAVTIPAPLPQALLPKLAASGRTQSRGAADAAPPSGCLAVLMRRLPASAAAVDADQGAVLAYADLLDRVVEDRRVTSNEIEALARHALSWNLTREAVHDIHRSYLTSLVAAALRDNVLTDAERADLDLVGQLLGLQDVVQTLIGAARPAVRATLRTPTRRNEFAGKSVCFTGESVCFFHGERLDRPTQELLAAGRGLVVAPRVTRNLNLLVLADPYSLSGKARKAEQYRLRQIVERAFWPAIGVDID
jgi:DNA polymerase-3 subunit epsilon